MASAPASVLLPPINPEAWTKIPPEMPVSAESSSSRMPRHCSGSAFRDAKEPGAAATACTRHEPLESWYLCAEKEGGGWEGGREGGRGVSAAQRERGREKEMDGIGGRRISIQKTPHHNTDVQAVLKGSSDSAFFFEVEEMRFPRAELGELKDLRRGTAALPLRGERGGHCGLDDRARWEPAQHDPADARD